MTAVVRPGRLLKRQPAAPHLSANRPSLDIERPPRHRGRYRGSTRPVLRRQRAQFWLAPAGSI